MKKYTNIFLLILIIVLLTGCFANTQISTNDLNHKCDYYTDNFTELYKLHFIPFKDITATGIVCSLKDKQSYVSIKNGLAHGESKIYSFGNLVMETTFQNGKKEGVDKLYRPSGNLFIETTYKNGKLDGYYKIYDEVGVLISEETFKNGELDGVVKRYYKNGILEREITYKNNKREGVSKLYYENGILKLEITFQNDKSEGITKTYYESGALETEFTYKNDKREGQATSYMDDGRKFATITYKNDKAVSGKCANGRMWNNAELSNWEKGLEEPVSNFV